MKNKPASILAIFALCIPVTAWCQSEADQELMEHLGDQRYRIGQIIVDRDARSFTVPGKILHLDEALEYLAVTTDGQKAYESLLELSTTGREFNLACILVGLDDKLSVKPQYQFDENKPSGQSVAISISWQDGDETKSTSGARSLQVGDEAFTDESWIYVGSLTSPDGREFAAETYGTLIGFVHDPYNVIEHVNGVGIGNYGLVTGNNDELPGVGEPVELTLRVLAD